MYQNRMPCATKWWQAFCSGEVHVNAGEPGGRLNKKDGLTMYGNSHVKDKTS